MPVTILHTRDGRLDDADVKLVSDLSARLSVGGKNVLLYLHGGLVDEKAGMEAAGRLSTSGHTAFNAPENWEQIYVVWRTGAMETLRTNWKDLFENDRLYRTLLKRLISFVSGHIHVPGLEGRALAVDGRLTPAEVETRLLSGNDQPFADLGEPLAADDPAGRVVVTDDLDNFDNDLARELARDEGINTVAGDIEAALAAPGGSARSFESGDALAGGRVLDHMDDEAAAEWKADAEAGRSLIGASILKGLVRHGVSIGKHVIARYRAGRDHGLHATVVEEVIRELYGDLIGSIVWGMMKDDAGDHFKEGALGTRLLMALAANKGGRLIVTGHSAGSIWASEMLIAMGRTGSKIPLDVILLAPAVRTDKFARALDAAGEQIGRFRIYAMHDALERKDVLLGQGYGFLYPSSLLYIVSGLFENRGAGSLADAPLLGMERFVAADTTWLQDADNGPSLKAVREFLAEPKDRLVFSVSTAGAGLNCDASSHGGFDDNQSTLASVATFFAH